jgi:hypothetical protein
MAQIGMVIKQSMLESITHFVAKAGSVLNFSASTTQKTPAGNPHESTNTVESSEVSFSIRRIITNATIGISISLAPT